jgi:hypothetical protein
MATYPSPTLDNLTVQGAASLGSSATITGGTIDGTPIGSTTPAAVKATTINSSGAATLASVSSADAKITGGTIDGTVIGGSTPAAATVTNLTASGTVSGAGVTTLLAPYTLSADLASTVSGKGADLIGYSYPATGASGQTVQQRLQQTVYATDFGAIGDGTSHPLSSVYATLSAAQAVYPFVTSLTQEIDYAAAQAAVNALPEGGIVVFAQKHYLWNSTVTANKGVLLQGQQRTDDTSNFNGSGAEWPRIQWNGASAATMYHLVSVTAGNILWGGGSDGIYWDGNDLAATAVHLDNTKYATLSGGARNCTSQGALISSQNGVVGQFSQMNQIPSWEYIYGSTAATQGSHGLFLMGNGTSVPATQQQIGNIQGLVYNGALLYIQETDNCSVQTVRADVQTGGTGFGIYLKAGGAQNANFNAFTNASGPIYQDNAIAGTWLGNYISEGGGINSGTSVWHGELVDYVKDLRFKSHCYALRKFINIPAAALIGQGATGLVQFALQYQCITLPKASTSPSVQTFIPIDYDLADGSIVGVEFTFADNGASGGNYDLSLSFSSGNTASSFVTPTTLTNVVAAGAQYAPQIYTFSLNVPYSRGYFMAMKIVRNSGNASDTNTDDLIVLGVRIVYVSTGPDSSGSGTYSIPVW